MGLLYNECNALINVKNAEELEEFNNKKREEALKEYRAYQNFFHNPLSKKYFSEIKETEKIFDKKLRSFWTRIGVDSAEEISKQREAKIDEIKDKYSKLGLDSNYSRYPSECPAAYVHHSVYGATFCRDEFCISKKYSIQCAITNNLCYDESYYDEEGVQTAPNCNLNCNGKG